MVFKNECQTKSSQKLQIVTQRLHKNKIPKNTLENDVFKTFFKKHYRSNRTLKITEVFVSIKPTETIFRLVKFHNLFYSYASSPMKYFQRNESTYKTICHLDHV